RRSVQPGGSITLTASNELLVDPGSVLDVSGIQAIADLPSPTSNGRYDAVPVSGAAGSITLGAATGLVAGTLRLAPGGAEGSGGSLTVNGVTSLSGGGTVVFHQGLPASRRPDALTVVADRIDESGADQVVVTTPGQDLRPSLFDGSVELHGRGSVRLVSSVIGMNPGTPGTVQLAAGYVQLDGPNISGVADAHADVLGSQLVVRADLIDLTRSVSLGCSSSPTCAAS